MLTATPGRALCAAFMFHGLGGRTPPLVRAFCNTAVTSAASRTAKGVPASYGKKAAIRPLLAAGYVCVLCVVCFRASWLKLLVSLVSRGVVRRGGGVFHLTCSTDSSIATDDTAACLRCYRTTYTT